MSARVKRLAARMIGKAGAIAGFDVLPRHFYSPVPALDAVPESVFAARSELLGIRFDLDRSVGELRELAPLMRTFRPPSGFDWDNSTYGRVEVDVLHALIRRERPRHVIELGSGVSSTVIAEALERNREDGHAAELSVFDPFPREFIRHDGALFGLQEIGAAEVPFDEFERLRAGDILFVDTTHTVKLGGDVNRIVLDVLPRLRSGVLVHFHDIFLPYEYPRAFFERGHFWAEQYLLQAYLADNPAYEVLLPLFALVKERPEAVAETVPSFRPGTGPAAFWIRRV